MENCDYNKSVKRLYDAQKEDESVAKVSDEQMVKGKKNKLAVIFAATFPSGPLAVAPYIHHMNQNFTLFKEDLNQNFTLFKEDLNQNLTLFKEDLNQNLTLFKEDLLKRFVTMERKGDARAMNLEARAFNQRRQNRADAPLRKLVGEHDGATLGIEPGLLGQLGDAHPIFPPNKGAVMALSNADIAALEAFYGKSFGAAEDSVDQRREAFGTFIGLF